MWLGCLHAHGTSYSENPVLGLIESIGSLRGRVIKAINRYPFGGPVKKQEMFIVGNDQLNKHEFTQINKISVTASSQSIDNNKFLSLSQLKKNPAIKSLFNDLEKYGLNKNVEQLLELLCNKTFKLIDILIKHKEAIALLIFASVCAQAADAVSIPTEATIEALPLALPPPNQQSVLCNFTSVLSLEEQVFGKCMLDKMYECMSHMKLSEFSQLPSSIVGGSSALLLLIGAAAYSCLDLLLKLPHLIYTKCYSTFNSDAKLLLRILYYIGVPFLFAIRTASSVSAAEITCEKFLGKTLTEGNCFTNPAFMYCFETNGYSDDMEFLKSFSSLPIAFISTVITSSCVVFGLTHNIAYMLYKRFAAKHREGETESKNAVDNELSETQDNEKY